MKRRAVAVIGVMAGLVVISVLGVGFSSATFHAQSANPTNTFTAAGALVASFGTPTSPTANQSRQIQFGLRLLF